MALGGPNRGDSIQERAKRSRIHTPGPLRPSTPHHAPERDLGLKGTYQKSFMSKAQLIAFFAKVDADPTLKLQVDGATDGSAVVAIAQSEGFLFSAASLSRHQRG